ADAVQDRWDRRAIGDARGRRISRGDRVFCRMLPDRQPSGIMPAGGIGGSGQIDTPDGGSTRKKRRTDSMQSLKDLEVGVMFWADRDSLDEITSLGVRCGQLGIGGGTDLGHHFADDWKKALADQSFTL